MFEKQFAESVIKRNLITPGSNVLIACSGGPDSSALCFLISKYRALFRIDKAEIVYFNHGVRPNSEIKKDISAVKEISRLTGFLSRIIKLKIPHKGASFENKARELRYARLKKIARRENFDTIITAHTSDDNAETVIMRLLRGSGIKGLGGILPVLKFDDGKNLRIVRPLIFFNKKEILRYLKKSHPRFSPSVDSTNRNEKYLRNAVRLKILPLLEKFNPRARIHLNNLARLAKEVSDYLEIISEAAYKKCVSRSARAGGDKTFLDLKKFFRYNTAIKREILVKWLGNPNDFEAVDSALSFLESPKEKFSVCGFTIVKKGSRAFLL